MCGIVGMIAGRDCAEVLLEGLKRLEYRGYDSAGISTIKDGQVTTLRAAGKLRELEKAVRNAPPAGHIGVGHTRWATHGRPTEVNAHPHTYLQTTVVHNGIIENYAKLKKELAADGHVFQSETDSEIVAHLVQRESAKGGSLTDTVRRATANLEGSFALAVLHTAHPDVLVGVKHMSPLVVGLGEGENYLASDIPALLSETRRFVFLEDGDIVTLTREGVVFQDLGTGEVVTRAPTAVDWTPAMAEKGGYKHFMLKEIHEQPRAVADTLGPRLGLGEGKVYLEEVDEVMAARTTPIRQVSIIACGTSFHAGLVGKYLVEQLARIPCQVEVASEFRYRDPLVGPDDLVVTVSQSGETADTLAAAREAQRRGASIVAICNVVGSSLPRMADATIYTHAGPEIGVASTKAFTSQMAVFYLLAGWLAQRSGALSPEKMQEYLEGLAEVPGCMEVALEMENNIAERMRPYLKMSSMLYLGRGLSFPMALEGALKLKELSYIHAEGYPAGEMKHGPIALIDEAVPSLFIVPQGEAYEKTLSNMEEIRSRGGPVLAVATEGDSNTDRLADVTFHVPSTDALFYPFLTILPMQLLAYHVADMKGTDVDQPRNLAKSVTVE